MIFYLVITALLGITLNLSNKHAPIGVRIVEGAVKGPMLVPYLIWMSATVLLEK